MYSRRLLPGYALGLAALAYCGIASAKGLYPTQFFSTLNGPSAVVSADLTGNGHKDLIEIGSDQTIAVLMNQGDGTFKSPTAYYVAGNTPEALAVADVNGDGKPDIIVLNNVDKTVSVLLGKGDGTFVAQTAVEAANQKGRPAPSYAVGTNPLSLTVADLNGDGKPDIAVANANDATLSILFGNGDGTFKSQTTVPTGAGPSFVTVADMNNDGKPDLLVINSIDDDFGVLRGRGDGTFMAMTTSRLGPLRGFTTFQSMVVEDFNHDGNKDVVITTSDLNADSAYFFLGDGHGNFGTARTLFTGAQTTYLAAADLNGNGNLDLIAGSFSNNSLRVMFGNSLGGFSAGKDYPASGISSGLTVQAFVVDDFRGTGKPDIAVINSTGSFIQLLYNDGNGGFHQANSYATGSTPTDIQSADLNGDGHMDIVEINSADGTLGVRLGNGDGTFQALTTYQVGANPQRLVLADVNGDGKLDAITVNYGDNTASVLLGNGDGTFQTARTVDVGPNPVDLAVADMDQDGKLDLIVANSVVNTVSILRGKGTGDFFPRVTYVADSQINALAVGDVDHDGFPDVVTLGGNVAVLRNDRKGGLVEPVLDNSGNSVDLYSAIGVRIALADVNHKGNLDMLITDYSNSQLTVLLGNRLGYFTRIPSVFPTCSNPRSLALADLNADGNIDVAVSCAGSSSVGVMLGNGTGGFLNANYPAEIDPRGIAIADFNEDGQPDLVVVNGGSDVMNVLTEIHGVVAADHAPKAIPGTLSIPNGAQAQVGFFIATDQDGDALNYVVTQLPVNGGFTYNTADGVYSYLANTGYVGTDSALFQVTDGVKLSNISTLAITVQSYKSSSTGGHGFLGGFWLPLLPVLGVFLARRRRRVPGV